MKKKLTSGFTLIELLVVIAIIGILAALVLVSLGNARAKAGDARVKSNVAQVRTLAEIYYDNNGASYAGFNLCETSTAGACAGINTSMAALYADTVSAGSAIEQTDAATVYCASAPLISDPAQFFHADSTGAAGIGADCIP